MLRYLKRLGLLLIFPLLLAACASRLNSTEELDNQVPLPSSQESPFKTPESESFTLTTTPAITQIPPPADPGDIPGYHQSIAFDGIYPVYNPIFAAADETSSLLFDDELVMGVAWNGEAKAYPVTVLRFREMVNDELAGIPTLVTW